MPTTDTEQGKGLNGGHTSLLLNAGYGCSRPCPGGRLRGWVGGWVAGWVARWLGGWLAGSGSVARTLAG